MTHYIGERLSYSGELCTVKFVGEIPAWKDEIAIGVEWDNPLKGKHNGIFQGVEYFKVSQLNSGSFLKSKRKHDGTIEFYESLLNTYAEDYKQQEIKIGSKKVESYGFEKLQLLQSDFNYLKNISLSRKRINRFDLDNYNNKFKGNLQNLQEIDLSFNLFEEFNQILTILQCLNIKKIVLIGNRFNFFIPQVEIKIDSVESLDLSLTFINEVIISELPLLFPKLKELSLGYNNFNSLKSDIIYFPCLKTLDLSYNEFKEIPKNLQNLSSLKKLNLNNNLIRILQKITFQNIEELDIRRNQIENWNEIDQLFENFPNLKNLRINDNPIFEKLTIEESEFNIIARSSSSLLQLNGVTITSQERINAELYFVSKINDGSIVEFKEAKFDELIQKYQKIKKNSDHNNNNKQIIKSNLIHLKFKYLNDEYRLKFLKTNEILKLKGSLSRLLNINIFNFEIYYQISNNKILIKNNFSLISSFNFETDQLLTIEPIN
ncbi:hypothetical protein WICMUC_004965 [Wickerhamomyces mucosus]|uniref:CAP-Gly domain-containing protein n=1 Tax=Wickerhamomyces mucosus TaxID=1378264 RepID=A0A9P8T7T7_9ASCO|nr:hypothetical protein WICMUC_004965 [Wickerhamomyces mucosus]